MRLPSAPALLALTLGALASLPAAAAPGDEVTVPSEAQSGLRLTVYQQNLALVQDRRMVTLNEGLNRIAFSGVSPQLRPETVLADGADGDQLHVLEQRFESRLLTPRALLEASVGKEVRIAIRNPQTGEDRFETAKVLANEQGLVLKIGDRIETGLPGRLVYDAVPPGLRERPTLVVAMTSLKGGSLPVELDYLTGGVAWSADYVAELDETGQRMALSARASIANTSGTDFRKAQLTLVAGALNLVSTPPPRPLPPRPMMAASRMEAAPKAETPQAEPVGDYYRFTFDRAISLGDRETVALGLLESRAVPVKKEYRIADAPPVGSAAAGEPTPLKVDVRLSFVNDKSAGLGQPLPAGVVRVYQRLPGGQNALLGEDRVAPVAAGVPVKLTLGQAFDLTAERRQTGFARPSDRSTDSTEEIVLRNARDEAATVTVAETLPGDWSILEESDKHEKASANVAEWRLEIPAKGSRKLVYRVLSRF
jgi:hypothetical protein